MAASHTRAPRHRRDPRTPGRHAAPHATPPLLQPARLATAVTAVTLGGAATMTGGAATTLPALAEQPLTVRTTPAPAQQAVAPVLHDDVAASIAAVSVGSQVAAPAAPATAAATAAVAPKQTRTPAPARRTGSRAGTADPATDTIALRTGGRHAARAAAPRAARTVAPALLPGCPSPDATADRANGQIPDADLCTVPGTGQRLRSDAAAAWVALAAAYAKEFGHEPRITDSYRSLEVQQALFKKKPNLAAKPGTSNHGLGIAVDLADGIEHTGSVEHTWMLEHAAAFGWTNPAWAQPGGTKLEPWHWEYAAPLG